MSPCRVSRPKWMCESMNSPKALKAAADFLPALEKSSVIWDNYQNISSFIM